jgi:hypothetical protein
VFCRWWQGVKFVAHVASPFTTDVPEGKAAEERLMRPAVEVDPMGHAGPLVLHPLYAPIGRLVCITNGDRRLLSGGAVPSLLSSVLEA